MVGIQQRAEDAAAEHRPWAWSGGAGRQHFTWSPQGVTQFPKCPCLWVILWYRAVFHSQKEGCFSIQSGPHKKNSSQWEFETSVGIWGMCLCPDSLSYFSHNSMTMKEKKRCPFWQWDILTQPISNLSFCTFFLFSFLFFSFVPNFPFLFLTASILLDPTRVELLDLDKFKKKKLWVNLTLWFYQNI